MNNLSVVIDRSGKDNKGIVIYSKDKLETKIKVDRGDREDRNR